MTLAIKLLTQHTGHDWITEHKFCERRWRFDYACLIRKIAIEVEGGVWSGGRHTRGAGFIADMTKYNRATSLGWRVLRYTPDQFNAMAWADDIEAMK